MSLYLQPLYESMVRQFTTTTQDGRFKDDFIVSINNVLDDLTLFGRESSAFAHVEDTEESLSTLDEDYSAILADGLIYFLILSGRKHVQGDLAFVEAKTTWEERKGDYLMKQSLADQSDQDDDDEPEEDMVGLGYTGNFDD